MDGLISTKTHSTRHADGILKSVVRLFTFIDAAIQAAGAMESGKKPAKETIERLGLPAAIFFVSAEIR